VFDPNLDLSAGDSAGTHRLLLQVVEMVLQRDGGGYKSLVVTAAL
jgi:hypothetical protein